MRVMEMGFTKFFKFSILPFFPPRVGFLKFSRFYFEGSVFTSVVFIVYTVNMPDKSDGSRSSGQVCFCTQVGPPSPVPVPVVRP